MSFDARALANPATARLRAYDPGHDLPALRQRFGTVLAELGSNENPLGPSARALAAVRAVSADIARYPDPRGGALKAALAQQLGLHSECIALGNGSHELLMLLAQCFADPAHSVLFSQYGFAVFQIAAAAVGAQDICVPALPADHAGAPHGHDLPAMAAAVRADTRLVYLANPNNPTGTWFDAAALGGFMEKLDPAVLVVVDEAYREYVDAPDEGGAQSLTARFPNLIVTRTFSKAYGLAGLRIGYLCAHPSVIAVLERLRESFNVNTVALAAAEAALGDVAHVQEVRACNGVERDWLAAQLHRLGLHALPSQTNFLLVDCAGDAAAIEDTLLAQGIVVRPMGGYGLRDYLRISIGTREHSNRLLSALAVRG